jgi:hypothetical protein
MMQTNWRYAVSGIVFLWTALSGYAQFFGGAGDGSAASVYASAPCESYWGLTADGAASAALANPDPCNSFDGGSQDGAGSALRVNPDSCGQFEGGNADGMSLATLLSPVPCTAFFASQRDGASSIFVSCLLLDVDASELYGRTEGEDGYLWWYTYSETNNLGFLVEKSIDNLQWQEIGFVPGLTESHILRKYALRDTAMASGVNYYRWRQTDLDGGMSFSNIVDLVKDESGAARLTVYPNPVAAGAAVQLHYQAADMEPVSIQLVDMMGQELFRSTYTVAKMPFLTEISTDRLAVGAYFLILTTAKHRVGKKIVVN